MKCAVITIAIGDSYIQEYNSIFRKNTEDYCKKNNYDFILINDWLYKDEKYKKKEFSNIMKWMIPFQENIQKYDRIAIVDADILITPSCPPLESLDLQDKIGMVNEFSQPTSELRTEIQIKNKWPDKNPNEYYKIYKHVDIQIDFVLNGGFIICSPKLHGLWFKNIFDKNIDTLFLYNNYVLALHFEQASLGYELFLSKNYIILDNKWNTIWAINKLFNNNHDALYNSVFLMHYAGHCDFDLALKIKNKNL